MLQFNSLSSGDVPSSATDAVPATSEVPAGTEQPNVAEVADTAQPAAAAPSADCADAVSPAALAADPSRLPASVYAAADLPEIVQDLDNRQRLVLVSLARGSSMTKACADAGVGRTTVYRWINEDARF